MVDQVQWKDLCSVVSSQGQGIVFFVKYWIPSLGAHNKLSE